MDKTQQAAMAIEELRTQVILGEITPAQYRRRAARHERVLRAAMGAR